MKTRTLLAALCATAAFAAAPGALGEAYPVEYWAAQPIVSNVTLSPDGKRLAMLVRPALEADPVLTVYDANDLTAEPKRFNADKLEITGATWITDRMMAVNFRGQVRERVRGFNEDTYKYTAATLDLKTERFKEIDEGRVVGALPQEEGKVLFRRSNTDGIGSRDRSPPNFYVYDAERGTQKLVLRGDTETFDIEFDDRGNPRNALGVRLGGSDGADFLYLYREPGEQSWDVVFERNENDFQEFNIVGYADDPRYVYVLAHNGDDKIGLWTYDTEAKTFAELLYRRGDVDVLGVTEHSDDYKHPDEVVAAVYGTDKYHREYLTDNAEAKLLRTLEASVPNAHSVQIASRAKDAGTMIVYNEGPRDPGTYYLLMDGALEVIGSRNPFVAAEGLSDVRYVEYEARDGRTIPAYLTVPSAGKAPYPLVVLPHGGPFVGEVIDYDKWGQMLANRGYLVLQPQYRGSQGRGLEHYTSAFRDGGQGGYKMQDDKDDGALYLAGQGLADPESMMMFGWSYGGYSALVAASRTPQIYQCAIAGASVPDNIQQLNYYRDDLRGTGRAEQLRFWVDSFSPIENAEKVNVPLLMIHGTSDQRTPLRGARDYMQKLDRLGMKYDYVELPRADHFFGTIGYENELKAYTAMFEFLATDCGMPTAQNPAQ
jgi:dipeptidyl aminopeptidase/acylaminoacyl peptidase